MHPIQELYEDENGHTRFRENALVRYLLDAGPFDLNHLATVPASREDHEQFAQLIGYSLSGFSDLSYTSDDTYEAAERMWSEGLNEKDARCKTAVLQVESVREHLRQLVPELFKITLDDLP